MALRFVTPSAAVLRTYIVGLADLTGSTPPETGAIHVPVWTMGLEAIANGTGADDESDSGCRFYAEYPPPLGILSTEMTNPSDYGSAKFRSLLDGELAEWGWARIAEIAKLPVVNGAEYELHLLSIPSLFVEAFYLRCAADPGANRVVPLDLLADTLAPAAAQPIAAYLSALQPAARARVATQDDPLLP